MTQAKWFAWAMAVSPGVAAQAQDCNRFTSSQLERALVTTESSANPYAIGVVNGYLKWQPRNKEEAVATALALKAAGYNFSMGCRQVNLYNLPRYGLDFESVFDPEKNSKTGTDIYNECFGRARAKFGDDYTTTRAALSCYYSGNFTTGQRKEGKQSYVDKVLTNLVPGAQGIPGAIPVVSTKMPSGKAGLNRPAPAAPRDPVQRADSARPADWDVFSEL